MTSDPRWRLIVSHLKSVATYECKTARFKIFFSDFKRFFVLCWPFKFILTYWGYFTISYPQIIEFVLIDDFLYEMVFLCFSSDFFSLQCNVPLFAIAMTHLWTHEIASDIFSIEFPYESGFTLKVFFSQNSMEKLWGYF